MRKLVTATATALTLGFLTFATPAMADQNYPNQGGYGQHQGQYQNNGQGQNYGQGEDGYRGADRSRNDRFDFGRHEGNSDRWERGWGTQGFDNFRHGRPLPYWRLVRRLEQQGFYGVRGLRMSPRGGLRAFAFNYRGRPVMLRVNPYTGRVLDTRYV